MLVNNSGILAGQGAGLERSVYCGIDGKQMKTCDQSLISDQVRTGQEAVPVAVYSAAGREMDSPEGHTHSPMKKDLR
jgi:hypothetical protein